MQKQLKNLVALQELDALLGELCERCGRILFRLEETPHPG